jgi:hypothetical protein
MALETTSGQLFGLPYATLQAMQTTWTNVLTEIAASGQSHAITGRTFTQANLAEVRRTLAEINAAIAFASGTRVRRTYANFGGLTR